MLPLVSVEVEDVGPDVPGKSGKESGKVAKNLNAECRLGNGGLILGTFEEENDGKVPEKLEGRNDGSESEELVEVELAADHSLFINCGENGEDD